jgi:hypothetical protein
MCAPEIGKARSGAAGIALDPGNNASLAKNTCEMLRNSCWLKRGTQEKKER